MQSENFKPLFDVAEIREKLKRAEQLQNRMGTVWKTIKRVARANPDGNNWYLPFIAAIDHDEQMIGHAKRAVADHLTKAEAQGTPHYLFNIWCFSFPHCRWAIWFDLLQREGFYTEAEADELAARFLMVQHRDHHAGLRVKPYPECVDNQAASLCLSSVVIGTLFADTPGDGHLARYLREEGAKRLEAMIGGMPNSGYSGEGSTYQGRVVAFAVPFITEMLERMQGREVFDQPLQPDGTSPKDILRMTSRLWMPSGLLLPWDDYGYQFGLKFPLAYLAHRTGDQHSLALLEHVANWSRLGVENGGWGFDEDIWTLIYWPETESVKLEWQHWAQAEVGASLASPDGSRYLMQMWDPTAAMCTRAQVNPNSLVLVADGVPLTADGTADKDCETMNYPGAVHERSHGKGHVQLVNLSKGCGGSHNVILVDNWDGMRPSDNYERSFLADFDPANASVIGDVTGLYKDIYPDCRLVRRRSRMIDNRFWLVEDMAVFDKEHDLTSRWYFRPDAVAAENGADVLTPEGGALQMRSLLGDVQAEVKRIDGFPRDPDMCSDRVDFATKGKTARWLWLLWPTSAISVHKELITGWQAGPCKRGDEPGAALHNAGEWQLQPSSIPWMQADVPVAEAWCFRRGVSVPKDQNWLLRLPRGIGKESRIWLDGREINIPGPENRQRLVPVFVECPDYCKGKESVELAIVQGYETAHINGEHSIAHVPDTPVAICVSRNTSDRLERASYSNNIVSITTAAKETLTVRHELMTQETEEQQ